MLRIVSASEIETTIKDLLLEENPQAIVYDQFEECLIGIVRDNDSPRAVYDYWACIDVIISQGTDYWCAIDQIRKFMIEGPHAPLFIQIPDFEEDDDD